MASAPASELPEDGTRPVSTKHSMNRSVTEQDRAGLDLRGLVFSGEGSGSPPKSHAPRAPPQK